MIECLVSFSLELRGLYLVAILTPRALFDGAAMVAEKVQAMAKMKVESFMFAELFVGMKGDRGVF